MPLDTEDTGEPLKFRDVAYLDTHFNNVNSIDPESCLVLLQLSHAIVEVVDWRTERRASVIVHQQVIAEHVSILFSVRVVVSYSICVSQPNRNYIHALRICGPYILCFRCWSIEAYPIPPLFSNPEDASEPPLPSLHYDIPGIVFTTKTALSRVRHTRSASGDVYTLFALARDQRRGMYYYQVHVHTSPEPALSVKLLGLDPADGARRMTAWDVGESGLRGAWVCTYRGEERHVVAFTTSPSESLYLSEPALCLFSETLDLPPEMAPRFDAEVVSIATSRYSDGELYFLFVWWVVVRWVCVNDVLVLR